MSESADIRRLAAVLAADVVGYSRLMAKDESGTLRALNTHRQTVFNPAVSAHKGRVVKLIGDGTLVEFASAVDAVACAAEIQQAMYDAAGDDGIVLRIGINLGDIIFEGDDIFGDGVNVAARLEPLAEPGGICIASIVNESVGGRAEITFRDGGDVHVKNIERPIRVWHWHPGTGAPAAKTDQRAAPARRARSKPTVAVLPFDNMSGDQEQEYFSDGMTEDLITDLSKVAGITVIARNSSFAYKGKSPDIRTVGRELGANAVLEGSVRRAGNRLRINAQLIDAETGAHIWAERYDRDLTDIFEVQDEVTTKIVEALRVSLAPDEAARIADTPTHNLDAHDLFLKAREGLLGSDRTFAMYERTMAQLQDCIALDPDYADAYAGLGMLHNLDFQNHWTGDPDALKTATHFAEIGVEKGPDSPYAHFVLAVVSLWQRDLARCKRESAAALAASPNFAMAYGTLGLAEVYSGNAEAAIPFIEIPLQLDPRFNHQYLHFLGTAYLVAHKYEAAVATFRERIRLVPKTDLSRGLLISALGHLGDKQAAKEVLENLCEVSPNYSFEDHLSRLPFTNPADAEHLREGYRKALED